MEREFPGRHYQNTSQGCPLFQKFTGTVRTKLSIRHLKCRKMKTGIFSRMENALYLLRIKVTVQRM